MKSSVLHLSGLDCANCAAELEEKIKKIKGVSEALVDFMTQKARIVCEEDALKNVVETCNSFEETKVLNIESASKKYTLQLYGLDCAMCAAELEGEIKKIAGVESASVNFMTQKAEIVCDKPSLEKVKCTCSHFEDVKIVSERTEVKKYIIHLCDTLSEEDEARLRGEIIREADIEEVILDRENNKVLLSCYPEDIEAIYSYILGSGIKVSSYEMEAKEHMLQLKGLDCDTCTEKLQGEIRALPGVESCTIEYPSGKMTILCDDKALEHAVNRCNNFEDVKVVGDARRGAYDRKIKIKNLCCANCGRLLEQDLNKIEGVEANVDFMNMRIILNADNRTAYDKAISCITSFEDVKIVDSLDKKQSLWSEHKIEIIRILVSIIFLIPALVLNYATKDTGVYYYVSIAMYALAYIAVAYEVFLTTCKNIRHGRIFDENFLMLIASLGAFALGIVLGDGYFEGVAVMLLYQVGELFQGIAVGASRRSITGLMDLKSEEATLLSPDGKQTAVNPEDLRIGDMILIKAGEKIPADGVIVKGSSSLDMKSLNGEPVPKEVYEGDEILSGGVNVSGVLEVRVIREYKNCAVAKILDMVENATAAKAEPEKFITKFARIYTPIVCLLAVIVAFIVPTIIGAAGGTLGWPVYSTWIYKALNFLLISCPCAMVISVPLSYFCGIGRCADFGILVKGSTNLDELALSTIAAFDKTGTLTEGTFKVSDASSQTTLLYAAAAEKLSSHPIAEAFSSITTNIEAHDAEEIAGRGIKCQTKEGTLLCGNAKMLKENDIPFEEVKSVSTLVYVALDGKYMGVVYIDDTVKEGAKQALSDLRAEGVKKCVMLTGDSSKRAESIAKELGLDECRAGLLPDEKLTTAEELKSEGKLIYVGDGINDAPVMVTSDCAVSMGKVGSDAAIEASDLVLLSDKLSLLPKAKKIAKGTRHIVFENIIGALAVKLAIMILSICITLPLVVGIVGDVGVMMIAVLNAMRIKISFRK